MTIQEHIENQLETMRGTGERIRLTGRGLMEFFAVLSLLGIAKQA